MNRPAVRVRLHAEPLDIFRASSDDQPFLVETVTALDLTKVRVEELGATNPGEYLIYCHQARSEHFRVLVGDSLD